MSDSNTPPVKKIAPGNKHWNWRGGRSVGSNGYVKILVGIGTPGADSKGYAYEHRLVAEKKIGRRLHKGEQVHHIDGNRTNNDPNNIKVCKTCAHHLVLHRSEHGKRMRLPGERNIRIACKCGCGEMFDKFDDYGRPRRFISGHNTITEKRGIVSDSQKEEIAILVEHGISANRIAAIYGVSATTIKRIRKKLNAK